MVRVLLLIKVRKLLIINLLHQILVYLPVKTGTCYALLRAPCPPAALDFLSAKRRIVNMFLVPCNKKAAFLILAHREHSWGR